MAATSVSLSPLPQPTADDGALQSIVSEVFVGIGAISVLVIVIAGFRYIASAGDPRGTEQAKNAILYAIIGLVISIASLTIVNFVIGKLAS